MGNFVVLNARIPKATVDMIRTLTAYALIVTAILAQTLSPFHLDRIKNEIAEDAATGETHTKLAISTQKLLDAYNAQLNYIAQLEAEMALTLEPTELVIIVEVEVEVEFIWVMATGGKTKMTAALMGPFLNDLATLERGELELIDLLNWYDTVEFTEP